MAIIWILLPLSPMPGGLLGKIRQMDWLGTLLSLAMTVCFLVRPARSALGKGELIWFGRFLLLVEEARSHGAVPS